MPWETGISTQVVSALALLVSVGSFGWTWYRTRATTLLYERQLASMRVVATRTLLLWEFSVRFATSGTDDPTSSLVAYQKLAQRLEEALDDATGLGLLPVLVGDDDVSLVAYSFFVHDLYGIVTRPDPGDAFRPSNRLVGGLIRLMHACREYPTSLPRTMFDSLDRVPDEVWKSAWKDLKEPARNAPNHG